MEQRKSLGKRITSNRLFGISLVLIIFIIFLTIASETFFTPANWYSVLSSASLKGVLAVGMTFVIIMGAIDLSVGSIVSLCAMFTADILVNHGIEALPWAILAAFACGIACGFVNGVLIAQFDLPPFLVTMGTMNIYRGLDYIYSNAVSIRGLPKEWISTWNSGIPIAIILLIVVSVILFLVMRLTKYGRYVFAVGGNETATKLSGINTKRVKIGTFTLMGITAAVCGIIYVGRMASAEANAGTGYELDAIAAAAIGGTSMAGGRGSIIGTLIGAVIMALLANGLTLLSVQAFYQTVLTGAIVIVAIVIDKFATK